MAGSIAIVLSGGGAKGCFQVGALEELVLNRHVDPQIYCGVSTGSIQALGGAMNDIAGLRDVWLSLRKNSDVYSKRFLGILGGLFGADSIYNADAIHRKIVDYADEQKLLASGKKLILGVVNLQSGEFLEIRENTSRIGDWVYASCAMPFFFQPMTDSAGGQWVDGGVRNITPLGAALDLNPNAVIVILASPTHIVPPPPKSYGNLLSIAQRAVGILTNEVFRNDIDQASLINDFLAARKEQAVRLEAAGVHGAQFQQVMAPIDQVTGQYRFAPVLTIAPAAEVCDTLEFDPATISAGMAAGRKAVADAWPLIAPLLA